MKISVFTVFSTMLYLILSVAVHAQEYGCLLEPSKTIDLGTRAAGVIASYEVDRGGRVRKGQVIAQLDSTTERALVELAQARVDFGRRKVQRNEDLYRDDLISIHEKDEVVTESLIAELEHKEAQANLEMRTIKSPINGVVVERPLEVGELVREGVVLTLAQINPLHVEVVVPASEVGTITVGSKAEVRPVEPVGGVHEATVTVVDPVIDAASGTFGVRLRLSNRGNKIPAGLRCTLSFVAPDK